jgi:hypothetical protein
MWSDSGPGHYAALFALPEVGDNAAMPTEPSTAEPPKRKRRWFQFSLRRLLIFTMLVAVLGGWLGNKIEQKRRQRAAAAAIIKNSGSVSYDDGIVKDKPGYRQPAGAVPFGPAWLRAILGDNFFSEVDCIYCVTAPESLKEFPQLRSLRLMSWGITDEAVESVKTLKELRDLGLIDTKLSDTAVNELHLALPKCYIMVIHQGTIPGGPGASHVDYPPIDANGSK